MSTSTEETEYEEVVIRATDGTIFVFMESTLAPHQIYTSAESFSSLKQAVKWIIDEIDYYLSNSTVKEVEEIIRTGGVAVVDLPNGSLTFHRADNREAKIALPLKKED